ncbi:conserved membrane hypothetical protein [Burkholderia diffusa]|uniref:DUF6750 family protein n=1 Tax=Burkholderia diffusa TaxID=488732 RepID=UPI001CAB6415|nr:DUF6750 family protein [Burkholderia diffusa]CAG9260896.1 conserved membrane hypothetical protein [Burkholderia diffusa]
MKKVIVKTAELAADVCRMAYITMTNTRARCLDSFSPRERKLALASAAATFGGLCIVTSARASGIADMANTAADQGTAVKTALLKLVVVIGLISAAYGVWNLFKKGKEGEHSQIKAGQIFIPIIAGACIAAIGFIMQKGGETVGVNSSSYGADVQ